MTATPLDVRLRLAALWTSAMFVIAYVDLFSLYRADVRAALDVGRVASFDVSDTFLLLTTLYVVIPSVMIYLSVALSHRVGRVAQLVVAGLYLVTVVGAAVGERPYYLLGTVVELVLLGLVVRLAWSWRDGTVPAASGETGLPVAAPRR